MMAYQMTRTLLDDVVLDYGPLDVLSRMLLKGTAAAKRRGISLGFESLDTLAEVNAKHRDSWLPITPTYDPRYWRGDEQNAFSIVGRDEAGDIVATQALRVFHWTNTSFGKEAEALRIFYQDPDRHMQQGERCSVTARSAFSVSGRVSLSGGIWFRPDFRGRRLTGLMVRLGRAYAIGRYDITWNTAVMTEAVFAAGLSKQVGHTLVDEWIEWGGGRLGDHVRLKFMPMSIPEVVDDMEAFSATFDADFSVGQERNFIVGERHSHRDA